MGQAVSSGSRNRKGTRLNVRACAATTQGCTGGVLLFGLSREAFRVAPADGGG